MYAIWKALTCLEKENKRKACSNNENHAERDISYHYSMNINWCMNNEHLETSLIHGWNARLDNRNINAVLRGYSDPDSIL